MELNNNSTNSRTNSNKISPVVKRRNKITFNEDKNSSYQVNIPNVQNTNEESTHQKFYFTKSKTFDKSNDCKSSKSQGLLDESFKSNPNYQDFFNFLAFNSDLKKDFNDTEINILFKEMSNQTEKEGTSLINTHNMGRLNAVQRSSFKDNNNTKDLKILISSDSENEIRKSRGSYIKSKNCPRKKAQSMKSVNELNTDNYKMRTTSGRNQFILRLLKYAIEKFESKNQKVLAKAFSWLSKEIFDILKYKADSEVFRTVKTMFHTKDLDLNIIGNYIQQFSNFNNEIIENNQDGNNIENSPNQFVINKNFSLNNNSQNTSHDQKFKPQSEIKLRIHNTTRKNSAKGFKNIKKQVNELFKTDSLFTNTKSLIKSIKKINKTEKRKDKSKCNSRNKNIEIRIGENNISDFNFYDSDEETSENEIHNLQMDNNLDLLESLLKHSNTIPEKNSDKGKMKDLYQNFLCPPTKPDYEIINYNENHLKNIETINFNIFLLEKEVGQRNILPAIAVYIFQQNNYYSKIESNKFENFIYRIVDGYDRKNPYHHVRNDNFLYKKFELFT
jgi:hypothetical protein